jgi:hypothetical protein
MSYPTVAFADATATLIDGLLAIRDDTPCVADVPNPRPSAFRRVRCVGGARRNLIVERARFTFECWAATKAAASDLARLTRMDVEALRYTTVNGVRIYRIAEVSRPVDLPDPDSDQERFTFEMEISLRGSAPT